MKSKMDLITYAVDQIMNEDVCRIGWLINKRQKEAEGDHQKAVNELAELVFMEYANKGQVENAMIKINEGLIWIATNIGDELYLQGFIDAAELMGVHITREDIQEGRDRENARRTRTIVDYFLDEEAKRISKAYGTPISLKIEEELAV